MHELSVAQALIGQVDREARARGASVVHTVWVHVGELSGVDERQLGEAFLYCRALSELTTAATLACTRVDARWACAPCGRAYDGGPLRCAQCGRPFRLERGGDVLLERISIEVSHV